MRAVNGRARAPKRYFYGMQVNLSRIEDTEIISDATLLFGYALDLPISGKMVKQAIYAG